jgi:hypothetical protein
MASLVLVLVSGACWLGLGLGLPAPYASSLLPLAFGLSAGGLAALLVLVRAGRVGRPVLGCFATALAVSVTGVVAPLLVEPDLLSSARRFVWMRSFAGAGLLVWSFAYFRERGTGARKGVYTAVLAGLALAAALLHNGSDMYRVLSGQQVRAWNVFHYYIGSKYFDELGYFDLYPAALLADDRWRATRRSASGAAGADDENGFGHIQRSRDMRTYRVKRRRELTAAYEPDAFRDPERWIQFGRDTRLLRPHLEFLKWRRVYTDLGYNPPPVWAAVVGPFCRAAEQGGAGFWLLINSDIPLYLLMFLGLWWGFGLRVAVAAALWMNVVPFNRGRFAGGILQYDWLASAVLCMAFYVRGRPRLAAVSLSWGAMTRVFVGFMAVPLLVLTAVDALRRTEGIGERESAERRAGERRRRSFSVTFVACCALLFGVGATTGRGPGAWSDWFEKIEIHSLLHPVTSNKRLGAGRLALHHPTRDDFFAELPGGLRERIRDSLPRKGALQGVGLLLLVLALFGRRDEERMILMLFAAFLLVTVSRYYGSIWILLLALSAPARDAPARWPAALAGAVLFGLAAWYAVVPGNTARYFVINYQIYAMFLALCAGYLVQDRLNRTREEKALAGRESKSDSGGDSKG